METVIEIGKEYSPGGTPYDTVKVLDIRVSSGRCSIKYLRQFGVDYGPEFCAPEDTKDWAIV